MTEEREQAELVAWFKREYGEDLAECLHHSPNGGLRNKASAARFKFMGVRRGFPDLVLYHPRGGFPGLAIEFKPTVGGSKPSKYQFDWLERLAKCGFLATWAKGIEAAQNTITDYMALPEGV